MRTTSIHLRTVRWILAILLAAYLIPLASPPASVLAEEIYAPRYVDAVNGNDANPGTIDAPFKTITHALRSMPTSETLVVQPGTYDVANGEIFPIDDYGVSVVSAQGATSTVIQGDGTHSILSCRLFETGDRISGLTFTGGGTGSGGAIEFILDTTTGADSPLIENNVFDTNSSAGAGGALFLYASTAGPQPLVRNNTFKNNTAGQGGAIAVFGPVEGIFEGNTFENNSAYLGGALLALNINSALTIENNTFIGNQATGTLGGAIYLGSVGTETQAIDNNTFDGNTAAADGGALALDRGNVTLTDNEADGNTAALGGFARVGAAFVEADNNAITASQASEDGGAWYVAEGSLTERNDTVIDGVASPNAATGELGAQIDIANSIYWNPSLEREVENADSLDYTCVSDPLVADANRGNTVGDGMLETDPQFSDAENGDLTLTTTSPCVDAADDLVAPDVDAVGTVRPQDGNDDGLAVADMGCLEIPGPVVAAATPASSENVVLSQKTLDTVSGPVGASETPALPTEPTTLPSPRKTPSNRSTRVK